jgi:hypothetical protein
MVEIPLMTDTQRTPAVEGLFISLLSTKKESYCEYF